MMKRILISLAFAFLLFTLPIYAAETRGVKRVEIKTTTGETVGLYEESHALVIGVSDYTNGWPKLPGVRKDVKAVTAALETHGFNVEVVVDTEDYMALDQAFTGFIRRHGRASVGLQDPSGNMIVVNEGEPRSGCRILEFREESREVVLDCGHGRRPYKLGDRVFVKTST